MKRSKRLQPVLKLADIKAKKGARAMAYILQKIKDEENKLEQLQQFQFEYRQKVQTQGQTGVSGQELRSYQDFIVNLDLAIAQQKQQIIVVQQQGDQIKQYWRTLDARHKGIEKVVKSAHQEEMAEAEKLQQREQDEFTQRRSWGRADNNLY